MGQALKVIRKVISVLLVVLAIALFIIAGLQAMNVNMIGADGMITKWLNDIQGFSFLKNLTGAAVFGLGLLSLVVAFIVDSTTATKMVTQVGSSMKDLTTSATGVVVGTVTGLLTGLTSSPIAWFLLLGGGYLTYKWLTSPPKYGPMTVEPTATATAAEGV